MTPERVARLEALPGWSWNVKAEAWEKSYSRLLTFVERAGHARVPRKHVALDRYDPKYQFSTWLFRISQNSAIDALRKKSVIEVPIARPATEASNPKEREFAMESMKQDLTRPDGISEDAFNRILWHATKGYDVPYPAHYAGAHGKGLKGLGLSLR